MEQVAKLKRTWNFPPALQIIQKIPENYCPCLYQSIDQVWWLNDVVQKMYSKMHLVSCINAHHDVTDLVNHEMVKNTKVWLSWEQNITFQQNKKILNLCHLKKNFMAPFYGWGSTGSRLEPLRGGSLLFTTKSPEIPGTHFIDLGRMRGWVHLGATQWFWTRDPWLGNPAP